MHTYTRRVLGILTIIAFISPVVASAQTTDVNSQIQSLLSQITALQLQLKTIMQAAQTSSNQNAGNGGNEGSWMSSAFASSTSASSGSASSGDTSHMIAPCPIFSRDLTIGASGDDVSSLQGMLSDEGFLSGGSTGFFGKMTAHALAAFQEHQGLASSSIGGFFGPRSRDFFAKHCGQGGSMGTSTPPTWNQNGGTLPPYHSHDPSIAPPTDSGGWANHGSTTMPQMPHVPSMNDSTTVPIPCPAGSDGQNQTGAAALFVLHSIIPGMFDHPCDGGNMHIPTPTSIASSTSIINGLIKNINDNIPQMPSMSH